MPTVDTKKQAKTHKKLLRICEFDKINIKNKKNKFNKNY